MHNKKQKVLIADDEKDVLVILEKELKARGYSVITADNGHGAMALARTEHPHLIMLDLEMPDMYGGDIARMLEEDPETKDIPIMFLTGMFPKQNETEGGRIVANHVLFAKPYCIEELVAAMNELLQSEKISAR